MPKPRVVVALACLVALTACDKGGAGAAPKESLYAQSDGAENLKGLVDTIVKSAEAGDHQKAAALTRGLIVDKAALAKALRDDAPAELVDRALELGKQVPSDDTQVSGVFKRGDPARTEVQVHAATTEEIAEYQHGSVPFKEFPGGTQKLAQAALRPGVKFYEVEFTKPGEDAGMKYHLFFWDGASWRMLGPAWRWLK